MNSGKASNIKFLFGINKRVTSWDAFNLSIYTNPSLSKVDKFSNVALLLDYNAAEATVGRNIFSAKFDGAIITLKKWFGQEQMIFDIHLHQLLSVKAVS